MTEVGICDHTSISRGTYSDRWGTPEAPLDLVRALYGPIDLDLASEPAHNARIQAAAYYSAQNPCPPNLVIPPGSVIWCNPPGPRITVEYFWQVWNNAVVNGAAGGFLVFKQDHWRALPPPVIPVTAIVWRKRLHFYRSSAEIEHLQREAEAEGRTYKAPSGANFPSTLILSGKLAESANFRRKYAQLGPCMLWEPI